MLTQLIVTSAATSAWGPGEARQIALAKPPQFHIKNKVTLIGFLGNDAEVRTANDRSLTTFSLATKSSYKDKNSSQYVSHTEWHRCVVFGRLSEFAKTLTKGAHVQVEGELRSREYTSKKTETEQRVWEIRVGTILKLDRAENSPSEDQGHDDGAPEGEAA
jgi:single-strand DNA-binding protein